MLFTGENSRAPLTESMLYNRILTWRPADSARVSLNPPRFSWPYEPTIMPEDDSRKSASLPIRKYSFQLAGDAHFQNILFEVPETEFNFYNAVGPLPEGKPIYWRAGYHDPEGKPEVLQWSPERLPGTARGSSKRFLSRPNTPV